jgi:phosphatidylinositol-3-phosphatase
VAPRNDDDIRGPARNAGCEGCGAAFANDQRYCLECGTRRGSLPPAIAARLAALLHRDRRGEDQPEDGEAEARPEPGESPGFMPSPRAAAVAVMGMLALGVLLGSATSQIAQSAGLSSILLEVSPPPPVEEEAAEAASEPTAAPAPAPQPSAYASSLPVAPPLAEEAAPEAPTPPALPAEIPEEEALPPISHVFLIVLGENGFEETFGESSPAPYLAKTLREKGELISNYYAVTKGDLANQIALISGQGPTAETALNCPNYTDVVPGTLSPQGQVEGSGCVYPATTPTLPGQLVEKKLKWKAYVEDLVNGCAHEESQRNPLVFFHSLIDSPECAQNDVSLEQLAPDLKTAAKTPALSYIVPNACHDGGEVPCEEGQPAGPAAAEAFLQKVVPAIEASPAYKAGGLIAITSAEASQTGAAPDASSCCIAPAYPNLPAEAAPEAATGPVKPTGGGGRVGLLMLSPFVAPKSVNETGYYNHYSLLFSIEELFGLERIGYAAEEALTAFDSSVYNSETSTAPTEPTAPRDATGSSAIRGLLRALPR